MMETMAKGPKFSGQREQFEDWVENWERRFKMVTEDNNSCTLPDKYATEILLQKIDEASSMELLMKRKQDPT